MKQLPNNLKQLILASFYWISLMVHIPGLFSSCKSFQKGSQLVGNSLSTPVFGKASPITTRFEDANIVQVLPDDFGNDQQPKSLFAQPRNETGGFVLASGFYEGTFRSYCLHAGTHAPSKGDGYLFAPLKGPRQEIIQSILRNSTKNTTIKQSDVQLLIWAVLARTSFNNLSDNLKLTASRLLSVKELFELNNGVIGILPNPLLENLKQQILLHLKRIMEAENEMRQLYNSGRSLYQDFERVAMLAGAAPISRPEYKQGRWSKHPDGYYVRYFPKGYSSTRIQVYVSALSLPNTGKQISISSLLPKVIFDPIDDVAVPANETAQRLGFGGGAAGGGAFGGGGSSEGWSDSGYSGGGGTSGGGGSSDSYSNEADKPKDNPMGSKQKTSQNKQRKPKKEDSKLPEKTPTNSTKDRPSEENKRPDFEEQDKIQPLAEAIPCEDLPSSYKFSSYNQAEEEVKKRTNLSKIYSGSAKKAEKGPCRKGSGYAVGEHRNIYKDAAKKNQVGSIGMCPCGSGNTKKYAVLNP